jgi:hypothetical protein
MVGGANGETTGLVGMGADFGRFSLDLSQGARHMSESFTQMPAN